MESDLQQNRSTLVLNRLNFNLILKTFPQPICNSKEFKKYPKNKKAMRPLQYKQSHRRKPSNAFTLKAIPTPQMNSFEMNSLKMVNS